MSKIYITKPYLPQLNDFLPYLKKIWNDKRLTNMGQFHCELEKELASFLGVPYVSLFANGTLALITALQCLEISGEVITTPFSFVATSHALWWNKIKPVFVDIEDKSYNIDVTKIEDAITSETTAILPVHVYGYPCNVEKIQKIADTHGLKVIYDAAHAFGVKKEEQSILNYGDLSVLSFHATKVFNTFEGGAIICHDEKTKERIDFLKNFGFQDEETVIASGINAKMNEFQAALGLLQLKDYGVVLQKRKLVYKKYIECLFTDIGIDYHYLSESINYNYSYFPIFIDELVYGRSRNELYEFLRTKEIFTRKYFFPLISNFPTYKDLKSSQKLNLPVANLIANKVLCLPIYPDLDLADVNRICTLINEFKR